MYVVALPMIFVVLWSTGFIGARLGLPYSEPMTFLAIRFGIVAVCLAAVIPFMRLSWPSATQWRQQSTIGFLNHAVYLGGVFVAIELGLEAGVTAVIVGLQPILIALFAGLALGERLTPLQWLGMALGFGGVLMIVLGKFEAGIGDVVSLAFAFAGLIGFSWGSILQKRHAGSVHMLTGNMVQFTAGAVVCGLAAVIFETGQIEWTGEFLVAMIWSIVVLSFGALTLYYMLIQRGAASRVASLLFLVPPCTAVFAWFLFQEELGFVEIMGMITAAIGVLIVLRKPPAGQAAR